MNDTAVQVAYDLQALKSEENLIRQRLASNLTKQAEIASWLFQNKHDLWVGNKVKFNNGLTPYYGVIHLILTPLISPKFEVLLLKRDGTLGKRTFVLFDHNLKTVEKLKEFPKW